MRAYSRWGYGFGYIFFNVKSVKSSTRTIYDDVGKKFDRLKGASFGTNIYGLDDAISPYGDLFAFFVHLFGFKFKDELCVGDFFAAVGGDIPVPYEAEGASAFNTLHCAVWGFLAPWKRQPRSFD